MTTSNLPTSTTSKPPSAATIRYQDMLDRWDAQPEVQARAGGVSLTRPDLLTGPASDLLPQLRTVIEGTLEAHQALDASNPIDFNRDHLKAKAEALRMALYAHLLFAHLDGISRDDLLTLTGLDVDTFNRANILRLVWSWARPVAPGAPEDPYRSVYQDVQPEKDLAIILCYVQAAGISDNQLREWYPIDSRKDIFDDLRFRNAMLAQNAQRSKHQPGTSTSTSTTATSKQAKRALRLQRAAIAFRRALPIADCYSGEQGAALTKIATSPIDLKLAMLFLSGKQRVSAGFGAVAAGTTTHRYVREAIRRLIAARLLRPISKPGRPPWQPGDDLPGRYKVQIIRTPSAARQALQQKAKAATTSPYDHPDYLQNRPLALERDRHTCTCSPDCTLPADEVHHLDGNSANNSLDNLASRAADHHRKEHKRRKQRKP